MRLHGFVRLPERSEVQDGGTIKLATDIDGQPQSVRTVLAQADYERAVQAHKDRSLVVLKGDIERTRQGWRLLNARVQLVVRDDASFEDDESFADDASPIGHRPGA